MTTSEPAPPQRPVAKAPEGLPRAVAEARITCQSHPWQAEGRLWDGPMFYLRVRGERASLGLGASVHEAVRDGWEHPSIDDAPLTPTDAEGWALFDRLLALRASRSDDPAQSRADKIAAAIVPDQLDQYLPASETKGGYSPVAPLDSQTAE